jgi:hypothetical protein
MGIIEAVASPQRCGIIVKNALINLTKSVICAKTSKTQGKEVFF